MRKKAASLLLLCFIGFIFIWCGMQLTTLFIADHTSQLLGVNLPESLELRKDKTFSLFKNEKDIKKLHTLIKNKTAKRVSLKKQQEIQNAKILSLEYGYKGKDVVMDSNGRLLIYVYKSDLRNKSPFHYIWFKLDEKFGNNQSAIAYVTKEDEEIAKLIKTILEK